MFAEQFSSVFYDSYADTQTTYSLYVPHDMLESCMLKKAGPPNVTVYSVDNAIRGLKRDRQGMRPWCSVGGLLTELTPVSCYSF